MNRRSWLLVGIVGVFLWANSCAFMAGSLMYVDEPGDPGDIAATEAMRALVAVLWIGAVVTGAALIARLRRDPI